MTAAGGDGDGGDGGGSEAAVVKVEEAMDRAVGEGVVVRWWERRRWRWRRRRRWWWYTKVGEVEREEVVGLRLIG